MIKICQTDKNEQYILEKQAKRIIALVSALFFLQFCILITRPVRFSRLLAEAQPQMVSVTVFKADGYGNLTSDVYERGSEEFSNILLALGAHSYRKSPLTDMFSAVSGDSVLVFIRSYSDKSDFKGWYIASFYELYALVKGIGDFSANKPEYNGEFFTEFSIDRRGIISVNGAKYRIAGLGAGKKQRELFQSLYEISTGEKYDLSLPDLSYSSYIRPIFTRKRGLFLFVFELLLKASQPHFFLPSIQIPT